MLFNTYESNATLFANGATLLILAGMLANTSLYRMRGRSEDRLFFALIITDIIAAVFGSATLLFYEYEVALPRILFTLILTLFFSVYAVFGVLWCMYLMFRLGHDEAKVRKTLPRICIPAAVLVLLYLTGTFTGFMDWDGINIGFLNIGTVTVFTFAPVLIYGIITVVMTAGKDKRVCILCGVLVLVNGFFLMAMDIDITPMILSIYLIYAHLFAMRDPFYGEVSSL